MRRTFIKNGHVVTMDGAGEIRGCDVLIEGEKITSRLLPLADISTHGIDVGSAFPNASLRRICVAAHL